ncbi:MAG: hypothetical protein MZV70_66655 [Desulfobacterales bacterium]|nr:hypothetical protein [Desulfobacterales bacterium]
MGGFFAVAGKADIVEDLYYGTDYHSHLGTKRGGLAVGGDNGFVRVIHNIENAQFRSKFDADLERLSGRRGIGVISDTDDQPLLIRSHLGDYAIATVGVVSQCRRALAREAFGQRRIHLSEMGGGDINPTEVVASLIDMEDSFEAGIRRALDDDRGLLLAAHPDPRTASTPPATAAAAPRSSSAARTAPRRSPSRPAPSPTWTTRP